MELSIECCSILPKIVSSFEWFSCKDDDGNKINVMPCVYSPNEDIKVRVNYCPSCGEKIRSIELRND